MTDDMDSYLRRLADAPLPTRLAAIEAVVLDRIAREPSNSSGRRFVAGAAFLALMIGFAGGLLPRQNSEQAETLLPLGSMGQLAPSSLLSGRE